MANATNRVLWWSLVGSLLVYGVVAHRAPDLAPGTGSADVVPVLRIVFALLSLSVAVGTVAFRRRALVAPIQSGRLDPRTPEGQREAFAPFIVTLVLCESVGIYGLVLAFLAGDPEQSWAFLAGALLLMWIHRPTASDLVPPTSGAVAS